MSLKTELAEAESVAELATENVLRHIRPDACDQEFADVIADWALAATWFPRGSYHMAVPLIDNFTGPLRAPDWRAPNNMVGISTPDRARAKRWCVAALLAGYPLYRAADRPHPRRGKGRRKFKSFTAFPKGSIADHREEARKNAEEDASDA
jgi:hypothetical protein